MQVLGNKSLSAILARIINTFWWLEWIAFCVVIIATIAAGIGKKTFTIDIPVTYAAITLKQIAPVNSDFASGILNATSGHLSLDVGTSWQSVIVLITGFAIVFAVAITITYQLKIIFSNFKKNLPFTELNISRIRNIAFILITYSVIQWLFIIVVNQILMSNLKWEQVKLTYSFNLSALSIGIVLVVIAEIFKLGAWLDNERKLTI